jgi:endonuclease VIII
MPEGDTLHRAAQRLQPLVGECVQVEARHPRALAAGVAERLDGRRLEAVEAYGKNLVLRFDGGLVLRSHLRMSGRWRVQPRHRPVRGRPWLVVTGATTTAVLSGGPVLELSARAVRRLGPDILAEPPDLDAMLANLRAADQRLALGEALLDQRLMAGIGNLWRAEALWHAGLSPWLPLAEAADDELCSVLSEAAALMRASVDAGAPQRHVYRRAGRACPRCGGRIQSRGQGEGNRTAYWCGGCQRGGAPAVT